MAETLGVFGFYAYLCHRKRKKGKYQSGQMGQTVNLLAYAFGGSNPSLPTLPTQRQPVVASVLFVHGRSISCRAPRTVAAKWGRCCVFLIYNERADQGTEQRQPR